MITILIDHNIEGQAAMLRGALMEAGWLELFPLQMKTFADMGLPVQGSQLRLRLPSVFPCLPSACASACALHADRLHADRSAQAGVFCFPFSVFNQPDLERLPLQKRRIYG